MFTWHFCIFGEKKNVFRKSHWEKRCVGRKDCHWRTLPENTIFLISYLHLATSTASLHQQNPPAHHHREVYHVCASIFVPKGSTWHILCQVWASLTNHRALFTTTKTHYLGFVIQLAAIWIGYVSFLFILILLVSTIQQAWFGRDIWGRSVALIETCERRHRKRTEKLLYHLMFFRKKRGREQRGGRRRGEDRMKFCPVFSLFIIFPSVLQGKNEMLSFPFLRGVKKKSFHFWSGQEHKSPSPSLALVSIVFVSLASVQDLNFSYFTHVYLSYDRFRLFRRKRN